MEKRYSYKIILRDSVVPEGLFELKDKESDFYLIVEDVSNARKITNLLNEQDQKIKELEEIVKSNNQKLSDKYFEEINKLDEEYNTDLDVRLKEIKKLKQENQQLLWLFIK